MTFESYCILFREKALEQNHSEGYINKCLKYAQPLFEKGLPIIYNLEHLSLLVGYNENYIKRAVRFPRSFYYIYQVPKKNGKGMREISQPFPSLKEIQHWVLHNILYKIVVSPYAKAYIQKRRLRENVRFHKKRKVVISFDIVDFFHSIKKETIEKLFKDFGYSELLSNLFSKILTLRGYLPQGAPTSPYLSNIIMINFDKVVSDFCKENQMFYTRYADDLTFSSNHDINISALLALIKTEMEKIGLELNEAKTQIMGSNVRQIVTGVVVNEKIQVPREFKKEIRKEIFYIRKFGLESHLEMINCKNTKYYTKGLLGRINFALQINPNDKELLSYKKDISEYIIKDISFDLLDI